MSDSTAQPARSAERVYVNDQVEVTWQPQYCIHFAACVRGSQAVFDPQRRPWIDLEGDSAERILEIVQQCPSGALHARRPGEVRHAEDVPAVAELQPRKDGPIFVRGPMRIVDRSGALIREDVRMTLCRCGGSANKPFCDGTHRTNGFTAP